MHARLILNVMINFHFLFQLSLLLAHVCMLPTLYVCEEEDPLDCRPVTQCKVISIAIHYFFTVCFTFMFLEGKAMHSIIRPMHCKNSMEAFSGKEIFTKLTAVWIFFLLLIVVCFLSGCQSLISSFLLPLILSSLTLNFNCIL